MGNFGSAWMTMQRDGLENVLLEVWDAASPFPTQVVMLALMTSKVMAMVPLMDLQRKASAVSHKTSSPLQIVHPPQTTIC